MGGKQEGRLVVTQRIFRILKSEMSETEACVLSDLVRVIVRKTHHDPTTIRRHIAALASLGVVAVVKGPRRPEDTRLMQSRQTVLQYIRLLNSGAVLGERGGYICLIEPDSD